MQANPSGGRGRLLERAAQQQGFATKPQFAFPASCQLSPGKNVPGAFSQRALSEIFPSNIPRSAQNLHKHRRHTCRLFPARKAVQGAGRSPGEAISELSCCLAFRSEIVSPVVMLHFSPFSRYKSIIREFSLGVVSISQPRSFKKKKKKYS